MPDRNSKEESILTELNRLSEKFSGDLDTDLGRRLLARSIPSNTQHVLINGIMAYIDQAIVTKTWSMEMKKARQTKELMTSYHISSNVPPIFIEGIANYILDEQPRISDVMRDVLPGGIAAALHVGERADELGLTWSSWCRRKTVDDLLAQFKESSTYLKRTPSWSKGCEYDGYRIGVKPINQ